MKKLLLVCMVLLVAASAFALGLRPATVKSMEVTITSEAGGSFSGTVARGDEMEIFFLSVQKDLGQKITELEEYLEIGGKKLPPTYVEKNGLSYAYYKIKDLYEYAQTNEFRVVRKTTIKSDSKIGIAQDYNLGLGIEGFAEFKGQTDYIESNDQELRSKAGLELQSDSEIETIRQASEWVGRNITYDFENYYSATYSAKQTYNSRRGVCDEFANLTAAFMRIKGIPARYVTGISFDGERFGSHGWIEVFLPGTGWIGVDSTYGEAGYVDGAHFTVAKTDDANNAVDFIVATKTRNKVEVASKLELPKVEVNSVETFSGLIEGKISKPEELQPGENFEVEAELKNVSGENAIFPVELVLHDEFAKPVDREKLVYIPKGETRTVSWKSKAPPQEFRDAYYTYGMLLLLPDGNISDTLKVVPTQKALEQKPELAVKDVSPFIENKSLKIKTLIENHGKGGGKASLELYFDGNIIDSHEVAVRSFEEAEITLGIGNVEVGKATLVIDLGSEKKTYEITIPEKIEQAPKAVEITQPLQAEQKENAALEKNQEPGIDVIAAGMLFAGVAAGMALIAFFLLKEKMRL